MALKPNTQRRRPPRSRPRQGGAERDHHRCSTRRIFSRFGHQQSPPQSSRLEDPQRGLRRTATLALTARCCINRMNSPNTSRWPTRTRSSPPGSKRQSAPSATAKTTPSQRPLMASTRPNSSIATAPGRPSPRSRSRLWTGSTGGTRSASTKRSPIAPRPKSKRPTLAPRRPRPRPSNHGTKPRALQLPARAGLGDGRVSGRRAG